MKFEFLFCAVRSSGRKLLADFLTPRYPLNCGLDYFLEVFTRT